MGVIRLRHKLVLVFLAATLLPLAAILWMSSALMSRSLAFVATDDVAALAHVARAGRAASTTGRRGSSLKDDAASGRVEPAAPRRGVADRPGRRRSSSSGTARDAERFILSEPAGDRLQYVVRRGQELWLYTTVARRRPHGGDHADRFAETRDPRRRSPAARPPARVHPGARACERPRLDALAGHRPLPVGPHQPADPAADDGARPAGGRTLRDARSQPAASRTRLGRRSPPSTRRRTSCSGTASASST